MKRALRALLALLLLCGAERAWAVNANPVPGSIWTWLGATFGADWTPQPQSIPIYISRYGADLSGGLDATVPLQNCLNAAGALKSVCLIDPGGTITILGNVTVPAQTRLDCGLPYPDDGDTYGANWPSMPHINLDAGHSILAGGPGVNVSHCLIIRNGMTFPETGFAAYAGTALNCGAYIGCTIEYVAVLGFDTAVNGYGAGRLHLGHVYADGTGITNPVFYVGQGGAGDMQTLVDVKAQSMAAGPSPTCANRIRAGTGLGVNGGVGTFLDRVIIQDFVTDILITNSVVVDFGSTITDFFGPGTGLGCPGFPAAVGVKIVGGAGSTLIHFTELNINTTFTGMTVTNPSFAGTVSIDHLSFNQLQQDCLVLGAAGVAAGNLFIRHLDIQNPPATCGRYAINYADTTGSSLLIVDDAQIYHTNGGVAPYIFVNITSGIANQINLKKLVTDLPGTANPFGGNQLKMTEIASAAALNLNSLTDFWSILGTTNITSLGGVWPGREVTLYFGAALTVVNGGNIKLANATNFTTQLGSMIRFLCYSTDGVAVNCKEQWRSL